MKHNSSNKEQQELFEALHYLHVPELKAWCLNFNLSTRGKKPDLIATLMSFVTTGSIIDSKKPLELPLVSKAKKDKLYPLKPETLILYGSYKNDRVTRLFFQSLIGPHFHFTVFGHDWIKQRWHQGIPPTYAEFAQFWQNEYEKRKGKQSELKKEWAYLNFMRNYQSIHPNNSKDEGLKAWEKERLRNVQKVTAFLQNLQKNR